MSSRTTSRHSIDTSAAPRPPRWAAFIADDWNNLTVFTPHWSKLLANDAIGKQTLLYVDEIAGSSVKFEQFEKPSVAYSVDPELWGRGIMSGALALFIEQIDEGPLYTRVVKDNIGSLRVLEKCGFRIIGEDSSFANARNAEVEEFILELPG